MTIDTTSRRAVIVVTVILLVILGVFYYQFITTQQNLLVANKLLREDIQKLDTQLNEKVNSLAQNDAVLADVIASQRDDLTNKIATVENKSAVELSQVRGQLVASEEQNKKVIADLEKDLGQKIQKLNVESTDFSSIISTTIRSVVSVGTDTGQGSGVFVYRQGYIVTNYHVVEAAQA